MQEYKRKSLVTMMRTEANRAHCRAKFEVGLRLPLQKTVRVLVQTSFHNRISRKTTTGSRRLNEKDAKQREDSKPVR
jgi:hypothetical protein